MNIEVLGIDLGKTVCSLAGLDANGAVVFRKQLRRHRLLNFLGNMPTCVVAMEACGGGEWTKPGGVRVSYRSFFDHWGLIWTSGLSWKPLLKRERSGRKSFAVSV